MYKKGNTQLKSHRFRYIVKKTQRARFISILYNHNCPFPTMFLFSFSHDYALLLNSKFQPFSLRNTILKYGDYYDFMDM